MAPAPLRTDRTPPTLDFRRAALVLLVAETPGYGYELVERLKHFGFNRDAPAVYRALSALEHDGLVHGRMEPSESGPARITYSVTARGMRWLDASAAEAAGLRQDLARFSGRHAAVVAARTSRRKAGQSAITQALLKLHDRDDLRGGAGDGDGHAREGGE